MLAPSTVTVKAKHDLANAILLDARLTPSTRLVGWYIADHVNTRRGYAWPPQEAMAGDLGVTIRTVQRAVRELDAAGYFIVDRSRRANEYRPGIPDKLSPFERDDTRQFRREHPTISTETPDKNDPPSLEHPIKSYPTAEASCSETEAKWQSIKEELKKRIGHAVTESWFGSVSLGVVEVGDAKVVASTKFIRTWIDQHYGAPLLAAVRAVFPDVHRVTVVERGAGSKSTVRSSGTGGQHSNTTSRN